MADGTQDETTLPVRAQLTRGMEHLRKYVTIDSPTTSAPPPTEEDAYGVPAAIEPIRKPATDSQNNNQKRTDPFQFGTRFLEEGDDIYAHNAWDHVEVDPQYAEFIAQQTILQRDNKVSDFDKKRFNDKPEKWWDKFYSNNQANFFKDRKWLTQEFPVLGEVTKADYGPCTVLEVGAGAGNTAFPVLAMNSNPGLKLYACDYSAKAIDVIRAQEAYTSQAESRILQADVWDAAGEVLPPGLEPGTVDLIVMIFIFSALSPDQWAQAVRNVYTLLKPGGEVLFRDYGRGDLAQVRFKKGRYLEENFYVRGDGTRVYFFEESELREIWSGNIPVSNKEGEEAAEPIKVPGLEVLNLAVDRRMLVNRMRKIKMYRCWMQGRFRKAKDEPVEV
jgi:tRNAThr (cytosine32-N3)-methyltransferase